MEAALWYAPIHSPVIPSTSEHKSDLFQDITTYSIKKTHPIIAFDEICEGSGVFL